MTKRVRRVGIGIVALVLAGGCGKPPVSEAIAIANCARDAQACADAATRGDADAMFKSMHPIVYQGGGEAKMRQLVENAAKDMAAGKEFKIVSVKITGPKETFTGGDRRFAVVNEDLAIVPASDKKVTIETRSFMLAVSDDRGDTWRFVDGAGFGTGAGKMEADKLFPELPKECVMPTAQPPRITRG